MTRMQSFIVALLAGAVLGAPAIAEAKCTRLAYSVNDYGKDGPTRDAKSLLDKHIKEWTARHGIKKYTVGKKDVKCELFLDFGFFDEHTCKASASVCWEGNAGPPASALAPAEPKPAAVKRVARPKAAPGAAPVAKTAAPAPKKAAPPAAPKPKAEAPAVVKPITTGTVKPKAPAAQKPASGTSAPKAPRAPRATDGTPKQ